MMVAKEREKRPPLNRLVLKRGAARQLTLTVSSLLLMCLTALAGPAQAVNFALGDETTDDVTISSEANWQTILAVDIPSDQGHDCQAVASLDAENPGDVDAAQANYFFTIDDEPNPPLGASGVERRVELRDNPRFNDPDVWPVSTNNVFSLAAGEHTIHLLGRKAPGAPNLSVDDASLSIICVAVE